MNSLTYQDFQSASLGTIRTFVNKLNQYRADRKKAADAEAAKVKKPRTPSRRGK